MAATGITYVRRGEVQSFMMDFPGLAELALDFSALAPEERGGTAKKFLAASAISCFCSALAGALLARGAEYSEIRGSASVETGLDDKKRARVQKITLHVEVVMSDDYEDVFERCKKIMEHGCLVTASLEPGIKVEHDIRLVC